MLTPNECLIAQAAVRSFATTVASARKRLAESDLTPEEQVWLQDKMTVERLSWAFSLAVAIPYGGDRPGEGAAKIRRFLHPNPDNLNLNEEVKTARTSDDLYDLASNGELDLLRSDGVPPRVIFEGQDGKIYEGNYEYLISPMSADEAAEYRKEYPEPKEKTPCTQRKSTSTKRISKPTSRLSPATKRRRRKT